MSDSPDHSDYEWHFKLSSGDGDRLHPDTLTEMARRQVKALLSCVVLRADGADLKVTGFRFLAEPDVEHAIYAVAEKLLEIGETQARDSEGEVSRGCDCQVGREGGVRPH
jgi:hypothetical protein